MKYAPLYNLIIPGYHKSSVIIRVPIYKFTAMLPPPAPLFYFHSPVKFPYSHQHVFPFRNRIED